MLAPVNGSGFVGMKIGPAKYSCRSVPQTPGSLFIGPNATVAYGDKGIGTNHVLPTGKAAKYTGGLWVGKFLKTVTWQQVSAEGNRQIAPIIAAVAAAEGMEGHAITARIRVSEAEAGCVE